MPSANKTVKSPPLVVLGGGSAKWSALKVTEYSHYSISGKVIVTGLPFSTI
jgi:hypothetical protein